jgi:RNA polymerase sigma-70 factor (ECF subfamily)
MEPLADEDDLVRRTLAGDRAAFASLVERCWLRIYRWLAALSHQVQLAEDLTQETFLKAWRALPTYRPGGRFLTWLFAIARHTWIDHCRSTRAVPAESLTEDLPARDGSPEEAALDQEGRALLREACAGLPTLYREAYLLWSLEDLGFEEIAAVLRINKATARWRVFKARSLLLARLGPYLDREPS